MTWALVSSNTGAANLDRFAALGVRSSGEQYIIVAFTEESLVTGTPAVTLDGTWSTSAEAVEVLRKLVDAVDASTY